MENKLFMVGSRRFADQSFRLEDLNKLTLIFRENGSATRNAMEQFLQEHEIKSYKSMELVSNEAVKQAVIAGIGFSIMPLIGLRNELALGSIKIFPIEGLPIITHWNLIYNPQKKLSPAHEQLIEFIETTKEETGERCFGWDELNLEAESQGTAT